MRVLVGCEFSGVVREAFNAFHGVRAISCDLLPPEDGRVDYHYQGDIRELLKQKWDLAIFFTPCTYLCNSGVRWLKTEMGRWDKMVQDAELFNLCMNSDIPFIVNENPIQHKYAREWIRKYDQIIQPYQFGHPERKATCLWLKGLPKLTETNNVKHIMDSLPKKESQRIHYMSPSKNRGLERSITYSGIATAMAEQWIPFVQKQIEN
jgi:hypothetical protein